eukprot:GILI01006669.1.p1 GENE.GILI01006669.1~~GILI01006669.1.p1  ORF type:complete len:376 (-),score=77.57 GILI01006669.1:360-1487(-)
MNLAGCQQNELLFVGFNQDHACFACGTDKGFRIYNTDPFKETFRRDFSNGGIGVVEMLFRCNILALVGGGRNPRYPPNKVMIWDDHQSRNIGELSFRTEVKAVKLRRDRVVVVLEHKIYVYNFADLKLIDHIETWANPKGLCALSASSSSTVLACPGLQKGHIRVELYDLRKTTLISAHEASLACISLNFEGTRLATCSEKGTLIRVFNTQNGQLLQELRRGVDRAEIYSLCFNYNSAWLAVSSDKGTIHVFALRNPDDPAANAAALQQARAGPPDGHTEGHDSKAVSNPKSSFSFMKSLFPSYFGSEWSFAQFRVPEVRSICVFGAERNSIIVVSADGSYYKAVFDPANGGECIQESYSKFTDSSEEEVFPRRT